MAAKRGCVIGAFCPRHGWVHGAEAEELRERLGALGIPAVDRVLDEVDARDSLAYLEVLQQKRYWAHLAEAAKEVVVVARVEKRGRPGRYPLARAQAARGDTMSDAGARSLPGGCMRGDLVQQLVDLQREIGSTANGAHCYGGWARRIGEVIAALAAQPAAPSVDLMQLLREARGYVQERVNLANGPGDVSAFLDRIDTALAAPPAAPRTCACGPSDVCRDDGCQCACHAAAPSADAAAAQEIMVLLTPLVADAAIVGRTYGWPDVLAVVRAAADKLRAAPSADLVALVRELRAAYDDPWPFPGVLTARYQNALADVLAAAARVPDTPPPSVTQGAAVAAAMDALESGATTEQRRAAWDRLRDEFYPLPAAPRAPDTPQGWTPLEATVDGHGLHIRIGIKSLANAVVLSDWAAPFHESAQDFQRTFAITDPVQFAREVLRALQRESDDGSTLLTRLLDKAAREAIDDGAEGCEFDCVISHEKRDPRETWSSAPPQEPPR